MKWDKNIDWFKKNGNRIFVLRNHGIYRLKYKDILHYL
jgi:hypothetical protein